MFVPAGSQNRQTNPEKQTVRSVIQAVIIQAMFNLKKEQDARGNSRHFNKRQLCPGGKGKEKEIHSNTNKTKLEIKVNKTYQNYTNHRAA